MVKFITYKLAFIFVLSLTGCGNMFTKNKSKFHWLATESAPKNYPMRIINGTFYYKNEKGGLYVPTAASIGYFWGTGESTHVVGEDFKPLPDRLDIRFFSFAENKLYQGSFDLPYDKILALFKEGVAKDKDRPTFNTIMVGVAPGGAVSVWLTGRETREVFFGQAETYEGDIRTLLDGEIKDRAAYARSYLEDLPPETLADIDKNGVPFGLWGKYRTPYHWSPVFLTEKEVSTYLSVSFFNGENYRFNYPLPKENLLKKRPLPLLISFGCYIEGTAKQYFFTVRFDEKELYAAFDRLGGSEELVNIEIEPNLPKNQTKVRLYNGKGSVELRHHTTD